MGEALRIIDMDDNGDDIAKDVSSLMPYSDGREWDEQLCIREIGLHLESMVEHAYEAGRRLIWAKNSVGHGKWGEWIRTNLRISGDTAQRYMQVAEFLVRHPALLKPAMTAGMKKLLLLTEVPDQYIVNLIECSGSPEGDAELLFAKSYPDLKAELSAVKRELTELKKKSAEESKELEVAKEALADSSMLAFKAPEDIDKELDSIEDELNQWVKRARSKLLPLARDWASLDQRTRVRVVQLLKGASLHIEHEQLAVEDAAGQEPVRAVYMDILRQANAVGRSIPTERVIHSVDPDAATSRPPRGQPAPAESAPAQSSTRPSLRAVPGDRR